MVGSSWMVLKLKISQRNIKVNRVAPANVENEEMSHRGKPGEVNEMVSIEEVYLC